MADYVITTVTNNLIAVLQSITVANGYKTDLGGRVLQRLVDEKDDTFPLIMLRMPMVISQKVTMGPEGYNGITYTVRIISLVQETTDTVTNGLDLMQDIEKALRASTMEIGVVKANPYERDAGQTLQGHAITFDIDFNVKRADPTQEK
jgi:hypothetical protein